MLSKLAKGNTKSVEAQSIDRYSNYRLTVVCEMILVFSRDLNTNKFTDEHLFKCCGKSSHRSFNAKLLQKLVVSLTTV